jgi:hypothetical protein
MPTKKVKSGYQYGDEGKVYPDKASVDRQAERSRLARAPSLLDDAPADLISEAFDAANAASRTDALAAFAPALDLSSAQRDLAALERDPRSLPPDIAVTVVGRLARDDRAAAARRILAAAQSHDGTDSTDRPSELIASLTVLLPANEGPRILTEELDRVRRGAARVDALTEIARVAPNTLWPTVLETVAAIEPHWRATTLAGLLEIAPMPQRDAVLEHALDAARAVPARDFQGGPARGKALTALITAVDEDSRGALVDEALAAAQTIDDAALLVHAECAPCWTLGTRTPR